MYSEMEGHMYVCVTVRERRFRVYQEAPGFRPVPHVCVSENPAPVRFFD